MSFASPAGSLPIREIVIGDRRRSLDAVKVCELAQSIAEIGLLNPLAVTEARTLIAGRHRLEACSQLGWTAVPVTVLPLSGLSAELAEIDENLIRNELQVLDRADHLARRKEIYEALHPTAARPKGGRPRNDEIISPFSEDTHKRTGVSVRTVQQEVQISEKIAPDVKEAIRDTPTADSKTDLLALARMPVEEQREVAAKIQSGEASTVKGAALHSKLAAATEQTAAAVRGGAGSATVYRQDAREFLKSQPEHGADLLITDPPYQTDVVDIGEFVQSWVPLALSRLADHGRAYICTGSYPEELHAYLAVLLVQPRFRVADVLVWTYRNTLGPSPSHDYKRNWQAVFHLVGPSAPPLDCPVMTEQFSVQDINAPDGRQGDRYHAWQKPDELAGRLIRHSTKPGQRVLDPFAGTGTFLVRAAQLGREAQGAEINPEMLALCESRGAEVRS